METSEHREKMDKEDSKDRRVSEDEDDMGNFWQLAEDQSLQPAR